ncbi:hypothetical protein Smar_1264 [Staphylothermus marinus F1]|uniref:Uncharacterized protein n=1 Tax=Staphylothermus marinus (strain ATCC 43588 / DSM 3639 / JCM 9404 / F1) TaxID=399550 RepID=A3DNZ6_STAMF|nr:hypothetical protein [Staphylothermus marinus]ABN70356.1 hypothetical protein Smar_1264 [Staphylothermus marinus F1]
MDYESPLIEYFVDLTEQYLGDLIEEVVEQYYEDKIDIATEYEAILEYIIEKFVKESLRGEYDPEKFEKLLRRLSRNKGIGKLVVSYLVSRYIEENMNFKNEDEL